MYDGGKAFRLRLIGLRCVYLLLLPLLRRIPQRLLLIVLGSSWREQIDLVDRLGPDGVAARMLHYGQNEGKNGVSEDCTSITIQICEYI